MKAIATRRRQAEDLLKSAGRAMHPREMGAKLGLRKSEFVELSSAIEQLIERGRLTLLPGGRVRLNVEEEQGSERTPRSAKPAREQAFGADRHTDRPSARLRLRRWWRRRRRVRAA